MVYHYTYETIELGSVTFVEEDGALLAIPPIALIKGFAKKQP